MFYKILYYNPEVVMGKRTVGNVSYSEQLFQGPDFSELCEYNGHCGYLNCRFRHYGENPRDKLEEKLKAKIRSKEKKRQKKKREREKRSNKKKNLKTSCGILRKCIKNS